MNSKLWLWSLLNTSKNLALSLLFEVCFGALEFGYSLFASIVYLVCLVDSLFWFSQNLLDSLIRLLFIGLSCFGSSLMRANWLLLVELLGWRIWSFHWFWIGLLSIGLCGLFVLFTIVLYKTTCFIWRLCFAFQI